jgi:dTDP-4-amino-4,6-dideoxygalactose transaminase
MMRESELRPTDSDGTVPFYDFVSRFRQDEPVIRELVRSSLRAERPILGPTVAALEQDIVGLLGGGDAVAVSSGTAALTVAMRALGIGPSSDVVVAAFGYHSAASCALHLGATVRFVDVDETTGTLDPSKLPAVVGPATGAVVAAHLFSVMADVPAIRGAVGPDVAVVEDSAIALGMSSGGTAAGLAGDVGIFSFHPAKTLPGLGDGGMVVSPSSEIATRCRMLRNHGQDLTERFLHHHIGVNSRMDELTAAYLRHRLAGFPEARRRRAEIAERYDEALRGVDGVTPPPPVDHDRTYYTYVVRAERRDRLRDHLAEAGIETRVYYPAPLHLQPAFRELGYAPGDFPVAEALSRTCVAVPLHPEMTDRQVERVVAALRGLR